MVEFAIMSIYLNFYNFLKILNQKKFSFNKNILPKENLLLRESVSIRKSFHVADDEYLPYGFLLKFYVF